MNAAGWCIEQICKLIGPTIFRGRLSDQQQQQMDSSRFVRLSNIASASFTAAAGSGTKPKKRTNPLPSFSDFVANAKATTTSTTTPTTTAAAAADIDTNQ
jgi:hypothetical protein